MTEISSEPQFYFLSGNIANMIPESPLNKMVPLTEDQGEGGGGGGGGGGSWGPPLAHGLTCVCVCVCVRELQFWCGAGLYI